MPYFSPFTIPLMNKFALITGASKGIGKELATSLARRGYHLLLVSRSEKELSALADSLQQLYAIKANYLACDLSEPGASAKVAAWSKTQTTSLTVLINNAGYGLWGNFADLELKDQTNMLNLNITAVIELSHLVLPQLKHASPAYILNLSSTAAYQPVPALALYSASKSFILSFSRALRYELKDTNISVSCLCPGPTDTGFASRAGMDALAALADKFNMSPVIVAESGLKGMFHKKAEIVPGLLNKLSVIGVSLLPKTLIERITTSLYKH